MKYREFRLEGKVPRRMTYEHVINEHLSIAYRCERAAKNRRHQGHSEDYLKIASVHRALAFELERVLEANYVNGSDRSR